MSQSICAALEPRRLLASWFVDNGTGATATPGNDVPTAGTTIATPFRTINYAAQRAVAGDTVFVRGGIYREEVRPLNNGTAASPIVYMPYNGESVNIRGTTRIATAWTQMPGSATYHTSWPGEYVSAVNNSDQVFVNDQMVHLTRWPGLAGSDLSRPTQAIVDSIVSLTSTGTRAWNGGYMINRIVFQDAAFTETTNRWVGAKVWMNNGGARNPGDDLQQDGNGVSGVVIATNGTTGTITVDIGANASTGTNIPANFQVGRGSAYYLFDPTTIPSTGFASASEWWRDRRGTTTPTDDRLYLRTGNSAVPTGFSVEVKQRDWAFNFDTGIGSIDNGRRYITVKNFQIFGASITTDHLAGNGSQSANGGNLRGVTIANASNIVLDALQLKYVSHFINQAGDLQAQWAQSSGVILSGSDNVFKNGEIAWSAGSGIIVIGARNKVLNSRVHDTNYNVTEGGAIGLGSTRFGGGASLDAEIAYNHVYNTGVDGIQFDGLRNSTASRTDIRARIHHNLVHDTVLQSADSGGIKMVGADGHWVRIDHNVVYNTGGAQTPAHYVFFGIYLDFTASTTGGYIVDHNLVFETPIGININRTYNAEIYNNTLIQPGTVGRHSIGNDAGGTMNGVVIRNNLANRAGRGLSGVGINSVLSNNVFTAVESTTWFVDPLNAALSNRNYALVSNATTLANAIDRGVSVSPFDDPLTGLPDLGAYEFGRPRWTAGNLPVVVPAAPTSLAASVNRTTAISLQWLDNAFQESGYTIQRSTDGTSGWSVAGLVGANVTQFVDGNLAPATRYFYRVRATNTAGVSAWTNVANAQTIPGNIVGVVYDDASRNGSRDLGETGLAGAVVYIDANFNGVYDPLNGDIAAVTNASGNFTFGDVADGSAVVRVVVPRNGELISPTAPFTVNTSGPSVFVADFGMHIDAIAPTVTAAEFSRERITVTRPPHELIYTFSEAVAGAGTLVLENLTTGATVPPAQINASIDAATRQFRFAFYTATGGVLPDGNYRATLVGATVEDAAGNVLAANSIINFRVLAGDADDNGKVDFADLVILARNYNTLGRSFAQGNFDYSSDGLVNFSDLVILARGFGQSLVVAPSAPSASITVGETKRGRRRLIADTGDA